MVDGATGLPFTRKMHLMSVVGARPQFIKLAPFSAEARRRGHRQTIVHSGQHYDEGMSARFFSELGIPEPDVNLGVGSGSHGVMTAQALEGIEREISARWPDAVVVFGDTNTTLAGALAAVKLHVPCAHIEAGLRSFARDMPEEINRVLSDHACDLLLAPNQGAMANLAREGLAERSVLAGDVMVDALYSVLNEAPASTDVLERLGVPADGYVLLTVHRSSNTDDPRKLAAILAGVSDAPMVVFPIHPRTRSALAAWGITLPTNVRAVEPLRYADIIALQRDAIAVATDSGGLQKEAYLLRTPCITLRNETEWTETVELGWNVLTGADEARIRAALVKPPHGSSHPAIYGEGGAASAMLDAIETRLGR